MPLNVIQFLFVTLLSTTFLIVGLKIWRKNEIRLVWRFIPFIACAWFLSSGANLLYKDFYYFRFQQHLIVIVNTIIIVILIKGLAQTKEQMLSYWLMGVIAYVGILLYLF